MSSRTARIAWLTVGFWLASIIAFGGGYSILARGLPDAWFQVWLLTLPVSGAPLSLLLYGAIRRFETLSLAARWRRLALLLVGLVLVQAVIDHTAFLVIPEVLGVPDSPRTPFFTGVSFNAVLYIWLFSLYALIIELIVASDRVARHAQQAAEALQAARNAQLEALRSQLNPHMLFNTFNNLSALVLQGRNGDAEAMLANLSDFMRACLDGSDKLMASLEEELELVQAFVEVETGHFRAPVAFTVEMPEALMGAQVPRMILQPLVENALKYAVGPSNGQAGVVVRGSAKGARLTLTVEDSGCASSRPSGGTGRGLSIVTRRLETLYGAEASMRAGPHADGFCVVLTLPLTIDSQWRPQPRLAEPA